MAKHKHVLIPDKNRLGTWKCSRRNCRYAVLVGGDSFVHRIDRGGVKLEPSAMYIPLKLWSLLEADSEEEEKKLHAEYIAVASH